MLGAGAMGHALGLPKKQHFTILGPFFMPGSQTLVGFSCLIACRNMCVSPKFHVSNSFLCLHAFGNVGGH